MAVKPLSAKARQSGFLGLQTVCDTVREAATAHQTKFRHVDEYVSYVDWQPPPDTVQKQRIRQALDFFQEVIPAERLFREVEDPGPYLGLQAAPPAGGRRRYPIYLTQCMFSFDFHFAVRQVVLSPNKDFRLVAFRTLTDSGDDEHMGNYYAPANAAPHQCCIRDDQVVKCYFEIRRPVRALAGRIADNSVDWGSQRANPRYKHGNQLQYFIWDARSFLQKAGTDFAYAPSRLLTWSKSPR